MKQLEQQEAEQRRIRRYHLGTGIAGLMHQRVEAQLGQQRQKQKHSRSASSDAQRLATGKDQFAPIGYRRVGVVVRLGGRSPGSDVSKKGDSEVPFSRLK